MTDEEQQASIGEMARDTKNVSGTEAVPADDPSRECKGCRVCCTMLLIPEFKAPPGVHCQHECEIGCAIHETKPASCKSFVCGYLGSGLDESYRPDNLNVMLSVYSTPLGKCLVAHETQPGAFWKEKAKSFAANVARREDAFVLIFSGKERQVLFPEWKTRLKERYEKNPNIIDCLQLLGYE